MEPKSACVCSPEDSLKLGLPIEQADQGGCLSAEAPLALTCWRTRATLNVLVSKNECAQMSDQIRSQMKRTGECNDSKRASPDGEAEGEPAGKKVKVDDEAAPVETKAEVAVVDGAAEMARN